MINITKKENCSGCGACYSICPQSCIGMKQDEEGFLYPAVNAEKCVNCHLCERVCPVLTPAEAHSCNAKAYAAFNTDETARRQGSSGGVFSALAKQVLKDNGVVFGAALGSTLEVEHIAVTDPEQLIKLYSSKYVQSRIGETYKQALKALQEGKTVLFAGTPCQTEGLLKFSDKKYDKLITVDIICHGVPSPLVWESNIDYLQNRTGSKITSVSLRDKTYGWSNFGAKACSNDKTVYLKKHGSDPYTKSFLRNYTLRPSCYSCAFKKINRASDITLGDFWGINKIAPEVNDDKGVSLVLINTEKGKALFERADNLKAKQMELEKAVSFNPAMCSSAPRPKQRNEFIEAVKTDGLEAAAEKYLKDPVTKRITDGIYSLLIYLRNKLLRRK